MKSTSKKENEKVVSLLQNGDYFYRRGMISYQKNRLHRARKLFERAVQLTGNEPLFKVQLATVLSEIGEYEPSNDLLLQVLQSVGESFADCYFFIANNYAYLGQIEQAEKTTLHYLKIQPNGRFINEARDLLELIRFEREYDGWDWEEFNVQEDEFIDQHDRARYLLKKGDLKAAIPIFEAMIRDHPTNWAAKNHLAEAYFRIGHQKVAFDVCTEILTKDHGNLFALCNLAMFYTIKGDAIHAEPYISALKRIYPLDHENFMKVAETLCAVGEFEHAYKRLKELDRDELELRPELLYCMGVALMHLNNEIKAKSYINHAAELQCEQAILWLESSLNQGSEITYKMWLE